MGRVSRRKIDTEIEERIFEIFWDYLAELKSPADIKVFLLSLLSYTEQVMLSKRLAIAVLLSKGYTYEKIDQTLKVSKSTIGTVHKQILIGAEGYKKAINYVHAKENSEKFWLKIDEFLMKLSLPKKYGSVQWEKKSSEGKKLAKKIRKLNSL